MSNKILFVVFSIVVSACAGSTTEGAPEPAPAPSASAAPADPFHFDHNVSGYGPGCVAKSTDTTKVQLRGETCTDDGAECYDIYDNKVEVWETSEAEHGTPFGAATFVEVTDCDN